MKRVLFLMSDTGGGHRAAAEAVRDAMHTRYGSGAVAVEIVDVYKKCLFPLNYMPEFYPWWVNNIKVTWGVGFALTNTHPSASVVANWIYLINRQRLRQMILDHPADVVVSVHSVITRPTLSAFMTLPERPPFVTVVTDLVSTPAFWYDKRTDKCFVPTHAAHQRGLACGMQPDQMDVVGLPVHPQFNVGLREKSTARRELGWDSDLPVVMLVAGGDGMGPLFETTRAINDRKLPCQLVVVAGRNHLLKAKLEAARWNQPIHIYGFVTDMPRKMSAADILVTKAGPATICEACLAGLPMILSGAIPGQETGNVDFVIQNDAGVFAPSPEKVAQAVTTWLAEGPEGLQRRAENARRLSRPNAVWEIAETVWEYAHHPPIVNRRRSLLTELLEVPPMIFPTLS